ncbi:MAG: magnesium transporter CorA family protein [Peptostreptococcaceae bacterium]
MHILNLDTREIKDEIKVNIKDEKYSYIILATSNELNKLKDVLNIDEIRLNNSLKFDESIKLDLFDDYDFLSINTFEIINNKVDIEEVNIYLSDNFILAVCNENHFLYEYIKDIITNNIAMPNTSSVVILFKINYLIFKHIIIHQFSNLEKVEDMILKLEDEILKCAKDEQVVKINHIRDITRTIVKNTRPLLYLGDRILKENIRYLKHSDVKKYKYDNLQGIDFGIEKLYGFALSTRELADKLLDIYSSQVAEKTNSLITKLTVLTGISAPLTIITGIYGMNFKVMPELDWLYGYYIILTIMAFIIIIGIIIFKHKKLL